MNDWKLPWEGGCRCGAVRIRVTAPPLLAVACHCTGCQRMSASAYSLSLAVPADGFAVIQGAPEIGGLHGPQAHHSHCPHCMSWMFTRIDGLEQLVNLRPTMLDDHNWYVPYVEFFTAEKLPWAATPATHSFETAPDPAEFGALIDEYAREGARPGD
jgi:hypothetical protein